MLSGRRFRIGEDTLAIGYVDAKRVAVTVPAGAVVRIVSGPKSDDDRMVDALWDGRTVVMFAVDVNTRGTEVSGAEA